MRRQMRSCATVPLGSMKIERCEPCCASDSPLMFAGAAKPACAAVAGSKFLDDIQPYLQYGHDDQLSKPLHRDENECGIAAIPGRHNQLSLVVGVNQANQVPQHDAMLVPKSAPGQDHCRIAGIGDMNGYSRGHQMRGTRRQGVCCFFV